MGMEAGGPISGLHKCNRVSVSLCQGCNILRRIPITHGVLGKIPRMALLALKITSRLIYRKIMLRPG